MKAHETWHVVYSGKKHLHSWFYRRNFDGMQQAMALLQALFSHKRPLTFCSNLFFCQKIAEFFAQTAPGCVTLNFFFGGGGFTIQRQAIETLPETKGHVVCSLQNTGYLPLVPLVSHVFALCCCFLQDIMCLCNESLNHTNAAKHCF